jgi:endo-1,4-beta-D-glucanase Y
MKYLVQFICLVLCCSFAAAQLPLKPFPQHVAYFNGVTKPNHISQQQMDVCVTAFYDSWKQRYIRHEAVNNQYYVWSGDANIKKLTVSEGQGYGMLIVALMAGYDTAAQQMYDGLFRYYKAHPSTRSNYLMAWAQTTAFKNADGSSASDGDLDIAYSLLLANAQWSSQHTINYLAEAKAMLGAIMLQEINATTYSILLSNSVERDSKDYFDMRSSDFMPAHCKEFSNITGNPQWNKVVDKNYQLFDFLQNHFSPDAGLVPDFIRHINNKPEPCGANYLESKFDGQYNYNACRVPWRIATDYIVNGDKRSKAFVDKINRWIRSTTNDNPDNISAGYTLKGDNIRSRNFEALSFINSFAVAAMVEVKNQQWLNKLWDYSIAFDLDQFDYYDNTIKMVTMIILSGNYLSPQRDA